jgi:hypothetical protein
MFSPKRVSNLGRLTVSLNWSYHGMTATTLSFSKYATALETKFRDTLVADLHHDLVTIWCMHC